MACATSLRTTFLLLGLAFLSEVSPAADSGFSPGLLTLDSGDSVLGAFRPSDDSEAIRWQGTSFIEPFEFELPAISSIQFPAVEPPVKPQGEFAVELSCGDLLTGKFVGWSNESVEFDTTHFGRVKIQPDAIRRLYRIDENPKLVFPNLSGLTGWDASAGEWHEDGAHVWTDSDGAVLTGDFDLPDRAVVEFELSWKGSPNFVFAIGVPTQFPDNREHGWRFEAWNLVLAAVRERANIADVAHIQELARKEGRIQLTAFLDQTKGEMHVFLADGTPAGKIAVRTDVAEGNANDRNPPPQKARPFVPIAPFGMAGGAAEQNAAPPGLGRGIRLINRHGDIRLERLRIAHWNGVLPAAAATDKARFELMEHTDAPPRGEIRGLNEDATEFMIRDGEQEVSVPLDRIVGVELSPQPQERPPAETSVLLQDNTRISGSVREIRDKEMLIASPELAGLVHVPLAELRSLTFSGRAEGDAQEQPSGRRGRLAIGGRSLTGRLVAGSEHPDAHCLVWHPEGSRTSSPLKPHSSGKIIYREPPQQDALSESDAREVERLVRMRNARQGGRQPEPGLFARIFLQKADEPRALQVDNAPQNLHLRSGDVIACNVKSINESGIAIETSELETRIVPHDRIKAIELDGRSSPPDLQEAKKQRLLTLPRLQSASPPTHLLCAENGDFLRCRLIAMTDEHLRVEVHLEEMDIPRKRVSQIIWFHPDELKSPGGEEDNLPEAEQTPEKKSGDPQSERPHIPIQNLDPPLSDSPIPDREATQFLSLAQVLQQGGKRVTFDPDEVDGTSISGVNEVVGRCRFSLDGVDQLLFGVEIRNAVAELAYQQWRLHPAVLPRIAQDPGPGSSQSGQVSPLVGQPAPDFTLELLSGESFTLSQQKGRIVVLDFWATWCGPCMQTMPLLEEAAAGFDPTEVRFISVNLEERAEHVKDVLERHKLDVSVALDIDGVAARRYEANAIPQLVIVGRDGRIARLYVGGGSTVIEELKLSLAELLAGEDGTAAPE